MRMRRFEWSVPRRCSMADNRHMHPQGTMRVSRRTPYDNGPSLLSPSAPLGSTWTSPALHTPAAAPVPARSAADDRLQSSGSPDFDIESWYNAFSASPASTYDALSAGSASTSSAPPQVLPTLHAATSAPAERAADESVDGSQPFGSPKPASGYEESSPVIGQASLATTSPPSSVLGRFSMSELSREFNARDEGRSRSRPSPTRALLLC